MKFRTYAIISILLILTGCNPNNPTPNPPTPNPVQTSWTMTVDNKTYSWTDTYHEVDGYWYPENYQTNPGTCAWSASGSGIIGSGVIFSTGNLPGFTEDNLECHLGFYPMNTGSWTISQMSWQSGVNNPSAFYLKISDYPLQDNILTWTGTMLPHNITLNVTEFATYIGGMVKGNFNGTYNDINNVAHTVSGQFNAIRID